MHLYYSPVIFKKTKGEIKMKQQRSISLTKRLALSLIALATPLFGVQRADAQTTITLTQDTTEQAICSTIYDETSDAPTSELLKSEIDKFAEKGLVANVLLLDDATDLGITDTDSMREFSKARDGKCGNGQKTDILVVVSSNPREFNTRVQNNACSAYWEDARDQAIDGFKSGLQDTTTSKQLDAALNLAEIREANGIDSDKTLGTCDQNIPIGWILGGVGAVGAVGAYALYRSSKSSGRSSGYGGSSGGGLGRSLSSRRYNSGYSDGWFVGYIGGSSTGGYSGGFDGGEFSGGGSDGGGSY